MDAILDQPLDAILDKLPVTQLIRDVVSGKDVGEPARVVMAARAQDRGDFDTVSQAGGFPPHAVFVAWYEAIRWADELIGTLHDSKDRVRRVG